MSEPLFFPGRPHQRTATTLIEAGSGLFLFLRLSLRRPGGRTRYENTARWTFHSAPKHYCGVLLLTLAPSPGCPVARPVALFCP